MSSGGQPTTELDILYLNAPSILGHKSSINYYIEVEMANRDILAYQRLGDFAGYCESIDITLFPILVTNVRATGFIKDCCILNMDDLSKISPKTEITSPKQIPGLAWDNTAIAYYILETISQRYMYQKNELFRKLLRDMRIIRPEINFDMIHKTRSLSRSIVYENTRDVSKRISNIFTRLEDFDLIKKTNDNKSYQLTPQGSEYIIQWEG